ncbi:MAG: outer membrane protein assembly factor BamA [Alphaproteobacteria bacterium]|nr:outer membrane protein assembly factor BamA [Alphaproteobacteria bacterium]
MDWKLSLGFGGALVRFFRPLAGGALAAAVLLCPLPVWAQSGGGAIGRILIEGNKRIEPETVRSYMSIQEGDSFDPDRVDRSLKSLFATGLFADVVLNREGDALVVKVVENPIINRIAFEGNHQVKDDALNAEIQLRPRVVYTRTKVQTDVSRIIEIYRRQGRFAVTVEPKIIQREQNRVDLVFEINEGPPTYVRRINFVGNKQYDDSSLREVIATKEERWYRFLSPNDTYDPDRLTFDRELLRRYYLKHGYADFRVVSAVAELSADREAFFVTFTIDEGQRYRYGDITVEAHLPELNPKDLGGEVVTEKGRWYNADEVEKTIQNLTDAAGRRGYAFVDVRPRVNRNREKRIIDLGFDIQEGPRVYVERVEITGNVRTLDKVIRREISLVEGDAFNTAKLRLSRKNIEDLNFFGKVEVNNVPSETAPDRTVIKVNVEEKSTGELSFGVGWSTTSGAMFEVGVRERNLLGRGQDLKISGTVGQRRSQAELSFTEPYFLGRALSAGVDFFAIQKNLQKESSYDSSTIGGDTRFGFDYNEDWRQAVSYTLKRDKIENVQATASTFVKEQAGTTTTSALGQTLTYDKRDSRLEPTEGYVVRLSNDFAGLGGSERFFRTGLGAAQYIPLGEQWILKVSGDFGYVFGVGRDVRINNRYFLGGDSLRGFASAGVAPRDKVTKDALGGNWIASGTTQLDFPLGLPAELGLTGKVFADAGSIGSPDKVDASLMDISHKLRASIGTGLTWKSPMGPISIDLGLPIMKESFDEKELFRFNFGTRF